MTIDRSIPSSGADGRSPWQQGFIGPLDLTQIIAIIRRRLVLFLTVFVVLAAATLLISLFLTPLYSATAMIKLDPDQHKLLSSGPQQNPVPDPDMIDTEIAVMRSPEVARRVVDELNLEQNPAYLGRRGFLRSLLAGPRPPSTEPERIAIAKRLSQRFKATRESTTYIVDLSYVSPDPRQAATLANAFAREYLQTTVSSQVNTAAQQAAWLGARLQALGADLQQADANVARYRAAAGIVSGGVNGTITDQQVAPISTQLATAQSEAAAAHAAVTAARAQMARGGLDSVSSVLGSATISQLRLERAEVLKKQAEISVRYGPKYPESVDVQQQLDSVNRQLNDESRRIVGGLEGDASAAGARAQSLQSDLDRLRAQQAANTQASVEADSLQRDADAKRAIYNEVSALEQQASQQAHLTESNAHLISSATPPTTPSFPNIPLFAVMGVMLGALGGAGAVFLGEALDTGLHSATQVETAFDIPLLAAAPTLVRSQLRTKAGSSQSAADYIVNKPLSLYAESMRNLRSALMLRSAGSPPKVIALTSALPLEGKTFTAISLAAIMGLSGERVLLVDCDRHLHSVAGALGLRADSGLVEVLKGQANLDQVILRHQASGMDVLPLTNSPPLAEDLFGGERFEALLERLRSAYDHIILDLPPALAVADARTLSAAADAVVVVLRWGRTSRKVVASTLARLEQDHANVVGAVLTQVDASNRSAAGAVAPGFDSRVYQDYYQE